MRGRRTPPPSRADELDAIRKFEHIKVIPQNLEQTVRVAREKRSSWPTGWGDNSRFSKSPKRARGRPPKPKLETDKLKPPSRRSAFTEEFKRKIVAEAIAPATTIKQIAQQHGVHVSTVNRWVKQFRPPKSQRPSIPTPPDLLDIEANYPEGEWTPAVIGNKFVTLKGRPIITVLSKGRNIRELMEIDPEQFHKEREQYLNSIVFLVSAAPNYDVAAVEFLEPYRDLSDSFLQGVAAGSRDSKRLDAHVAGTVLAFRRVLMKARGLFHQVDLPSAKKMTPEILNDILQRLKEGQDKRLVKKQIAIDYGLSYDSISYIEKHGGLKQMRFQNPTHKMCSHCNVEKPISEFTTYLYKSRFGEKRKKWRAECKVCRNLLDQRRRNPHGGKYRHSSAAKRRVRRNRNLKRIKNVILELISQRKPVTAKEVCYYTGFVYNGYFHKTYWTHPVIVELRQEYLDPVNRIVKAIGELREAKKNRITHHAVSVQSGVRQRTVETYWSDPRVVAALGPSTVERIKTGLRDILAAGGEVSQVGVADAIGLHKSTVSLHWHDPDIAAIHGQPRVFGKGNYKRAALQQPGETGEFAGDFALPTQSAD